MQMENASKNVYILLGGNWHLYHKIAAVLKTFYGYRIKAICYNPVVYKQVGNYNKINSVYEQIYSLSDESKYYTPIQNTSIFNYLSLNEIIQTDRYFSQVRIFNHDPLEEYFLKIANVFYKIFTMDHVKAIIFEPSSAYSLIAEQVARFLGIKTIYPQWPRTRYGFEISESSNGFFPLHERVFNEVLTNYRSYFPQLTGKVMDFLKKFESGELKPFYKKLYGENFFIKLKDKISTLTYMLSNVNDQYVRYQIFKTFVNIFSPHINRLNNKKYFSRHTQISETKYFFYGLHYDPDLASLLWSKTLNNQIEIIRLISLSLPMGYKLFVKEHPAQKYNRSPRFYKKLKSFHNVELVRAEEDSFKYIKGSVANIILTGTIGFESIIFGKKPIVLGDNFYKDERLIIYINNFRDLKNILKKIIEKPYMITIERDVIYAFILSYLLAVTPLKNIYQGTYSYKFVDKLEVKPIADKINLIINEGDRSN